MIETVEVRQVVEEIKKRDGRVVEFDSSKITAAIAKAGNATGEFNEREAKKLTLKALTLVHELRLGPVPEVEDIQDIVERVLLDSPFYKTAKAYILYRNNMPRLDGLPPKPTLIWWIIISRKKTGKLKKTAICAILCKG